MPGQTQRTISANSLPALESVAFQHMGADLQAVCSGSRRVSRPRYDGWVKGVTRRHPMPKEEPEELRRIRLTAGPSGMPESGSVKNPVRDAAQR